MKKIIVSDVQESIFSWYMENGRHDLPWRKTEDLYYIAVSEVMLQQTNVPKVIEKFGVFMKSFPTIYDLARAEQKEVIKLWQGLGYNRRAIYLHKMAQSIVHEYDGVFPEDPKILITLYGIGPYTSRSILIFALNENIVTWDVNIVRIVKRFFKKNDVDDKMIEELCMDLLPHGRSRDWHNALMDFASLICTKRSPKCMQCPLKMVCCSYPSPDDVVEVKRKEVGRKENGRHIPRRIYRGRIVEFLRDNIGTTDEIGVVIKNDWLLSKDYKWCENVLKGLEKDGIIMCKKGKWMLQ